MANSFKVISETDFNKYQTAWLDAIAANRVYNQFQIDSEPFYGYTIGQDLVTALISRVGIKKVVVSFGIDTTNNTFTIILYGMDSCSNPNVVSSYYQITTDKAITSPFNGFIPVTDPANSVLYPDYVPYALAKQWIGLCENVIQKALMPPPSPIPVSLFKVWYVKDENRLKSYSFDINTFKEAIYRAMTKYSSVQDNLSANLYFSIRKADPATPLDEQDIFGVIIQWVDDDKQTYYFDLTTPCPPCCPGCP